MIYFSEKIKWMIYHFGERMIDKLKNCEQILFYCDNIYAL